MELPLESICMVLRIVITGLRPGDSSMVGHEVLLNKLEVLTTVRSLA